MGTNIVRGLAPGILLEYFWDAVLLTIPLSYILLWWYRRAVDRAMRAATGGYSAEWIDHAAPFAGLSLGGDSIHLAEGSSRFRLVVVFITAAALGSAAWTTIFFYSPDMEFLPLRAFVVWYAYCWPAVPALAALLAAPRRRALSMFAGYVLAGAFATLVWSLVSRFALGRMNVSPLGNAANFLLFLAMEAGAPVLVVLVVTSRRIRGVSPLALAGLLVFSFGTLLVSEAFLSLVDIKSFRDRVPSLGGSALSVWFMVFSLGVGYLCWRGLGALNARFQRKSFSDIQLVADSWWLIAAFSLSVGFASDFGWKGIIGLAGFVVYRAVAWLGLLLWPPPGGPGARLLLLRVFGFQKRTEKLFDSIAGRWRFRGAVKMIAGTDLAARTIDPDDTLAFVGGDLSSRFVRSPDDLSRRLEQVDEARDPDGRFRVTEFFCYDNTWRLTLAALLRRSDVVLMDLRSFSPANSGCLFELEQLAQQCRLERTVFVVDRTTDVALLEATLRREAGTAGVMPALYFERVEKGASEEHDRAYLALQRLTANRA